MTHTARRLSAFKSNTGPYDGTRGIVFDLRLWNRAAWALRDVYGFPANTSQTIRAAVQHARNGMRAGMKPWAAMAAACEELGISRDDMSKAILGMRGAK